MRTLEERKAEVMRRSKKRIAHRRRMISGVACCAIVAVAATAGVAVWYDPPELLSEYYAGGTQEGADIGSAFPNYGGKTECDEDGSQTFAATVSDGETVTRYTDADDIAEILSALESAKASTDPVAATEPADGNANGSSLLPEVQKETAVTVTDLQYSITVGKQWYLLVPNKLIDVAAQLHYELSDEVYETLLAVIGAS